MKFMKICASYHYKSDKPNGKSSWLGKLFYCPQTISHPTQCAYANWICSLKSTGYEALHITVMGPLGKFGWKYKYAGDRMHGNCKEKGYAAHYKYKPPAIKKKLGLKKAQ